MLVTFKTSAYSDITMFGSAAVSLLKLMGQSGNVPGAIMSDDIPQAVKTLQQALASLRAQDEAGGAASADAEPAPFDDQDGAKPVALYTRAGPLICLLEAAAESGENVQWDS